MRIKGLFWILTGLLLTILAVITYHVFYNYSSFMFFIVEGVVLVTILYLFLFTGVSSSRWILSAMVWSC